MKYIIIFILATSLSQVSHSQDVKRFRVYSTRALFYDHRNKEWMQDTTNMFNSKQKVIISIEGSTLIIAYGEKTMYKLNAISDEGKYDNDSWQLWKDAIDDNGKPIIVYCFQNRVEKEFYIRICDSDLDTGLHFDVIPL